MAHSNTLFHELLKLIPRHQFDTIVKNYGGNRYVKRFNCWQQLVTLLYAQAAAMLQQLQDAPGFTPVIINIQPIGNLKMFLGLREKEEQLT